MITVKNHILIILFFVTVASCLVQLSAEQKRAAYNQSPNATSAASSGSDAEDFSLIGLLTLKLM